MIYSSKKLTTSLGVIAKLDVSFFTCGFSTGTSISMAGAAAVEKNLGVLANATRGRRSEDEACLTLENMADKYRSHS